MTATPDADERRIRDSLHARIDGTPPPAVPARARDWLDDYMDATTAPKPPNVPEEPPAAGDTPGEPRWDWRRLLHWPNGGIGVRLCCALAAIAAPILHVGYSASTTWWYCVHQTRTHYGIGWGYALGGAALALAINAVLHRGRRAGLVRIVVLAIAAVGFLGAMSWTDPIALLTGAPN